ncbi:unnamed protein product [Linum tenue]|uniref:Peptidase C1A papain C-terminal domain-containing protein n=1 Tax=Linum tenue TaxID=586396 RepID=A0AAV0L766_9ROSI|nr:unnamed protein product [Linum tenue]
MRVTLPTPATAMTSETPEKKERVDSSPANEEKRASLKKEMTMKDESEKNDGGGLPPEERTLKPTTEAGWPPCRQLRASPSWKDRSCSASKEENLAATIKGYEDVPANNEVALMKAVASQPISVAIDAGDSSFQLYGSGIFT